MYRARDTKLDRDVALKVLPQAFTDDPDRLARFKREAKVREAKAEGMWPGLREKSSLGIPLVRHGSLKSAVCQPIARIATSMSQLVFCVPPCSSSYAGCVRERG